MKGTVIAGDEDQAADYISDSCIEDEEYDDLDSDNYDYGELNLELLEESIDDPSDDEQDDTLDKNPIPSYFLSDISQL
jgi:hypothetical protein